MLKTVLAKSIDNIFQFYKNNRYTIKTFLLYREFGCIRDSLPEEVNLNTTATNEYVTNIEHKNHVIKDYARALIGNFPFKNKSGIIIIELILFVEHWLNQEPWDNGV